MSPIPSWALGTAFIVVVVAAAQVVMRRVLGWDAPRGARRGAEPAAAHVTDTLDDMQRRLAEVEERLDFAERLLTKERGAERLGPPNV